MNSKILTSAVVAASLLAPAVAFAATTSATESKAEANKPAVHHMMKTSHATVGMSSRSMAKSRPGGEPVSRKAAD